MRLAEQTLEQIFEMQNKRSTKYDNFNEIFFLRVCFLSVDTAQMCGEISQRTRKYFLSVTMAKV